MDSGSQDEPESESAPLRSLVPLVATTSTAWLLFALVNYAAGGRPHVAMLDLAVGAASWAVLGLLHLRPQRWRIALHAGAVLSSIGMVLTAWWTGGWMGISWWLLAAVPLYVGYLATVRESLVWTLISAVCVVLSGLPVFEQEFAVAPLQRALGGLVLIGVSCVFVIAARRRYEAQLLKTRAHGLELARASEDRARAAEAKASLLATIGHEIRTPLHGVLGTASVLAFSNLEREQRELVDAIRASGEALERIVNHTVDFARLEVGKLEINAAPRDLATDLEDLVDLFAASAAEQQLELAAIIPSELRVHADALRIRQIVGNLLGNAIKFTQEGHVLLRATVEPGEPGVSLVTLVVEDTGPGFPPERIANLFTAFEQPDARLARLHGGSGLGLSISRDLSRLMGGELVASNRGEGGARFEVTLPLPRAELPVRYQLAERARAVYVEPRSRLREGAASCARAVGVDLHVAARVSDVPKDVSPAVVFIGLSHRYDVIEQRQRASKRWPSAQCVLVGPARALALSGGGVEAAGFHFTTLEPLRRSRIFAFFAPAESAHISAPPVDARLRVLVVDDDKINREIVRRTLAHLGHDTVLAVDGTDGLTQLLENRFDVALIDLHMPGLDGVGLARRAKETLGNATPRLVAFTASVTDADRRRCQEAGFDDFLGKPLAEGSLVRALAQADATQSDELRTRALPVELPGVDSQELDRLVSLMGGVDETRPLLDDFSESAREHLSTLRADEDLRESVRAAHTLASSAASLGLRRVGELAKALELEAHQMPAAERRRRAETISTELSLGLRWLDERIPRSQGGQVPQNMSRIVVPERLDGSTLTRLLTNAEPSFHEEQWRLIGDIRPLRDFSPDARDVFVTWFRARKQRVARIALVMDERQAMRAIIPLLGFAAGVPLRAFLDEQEAAQWVAESTSNAASPNTGSSDTGSSDTATALTTTSDTAT